ncbi:MAG TPA: preprotein translocase subunit SecY [Armatimonadota bacterium]|nr:preprotein translocase subunit SecY [Armatimonadota bacterium]HQK94143.1 preprotein translocase subunit SecY [Armatimonadota bacterium]
MARAQVTQTSKMRQTLVDAVSLPDVRKRILFVGAMFAVYVGCIHIPVPGIRHDALENIFGGAGGSNILDLMNAFAGGALKRMSVIGLGIMPYINASIIFQLLTIAVPSLERLQRDEGDYGRKLIAKYVRWLTVFLAFVQAVGLITVLRGMNAVEPGVGLGFLMVISLAAGTSFLMWIAEELTDKGIGNGVSLVIFCGIMCNMPQEIGRTLAQARAGAINVPQLLLLAICLVMIIALIIFVQQGQRRLRVQYAKRVVGHRVYGGHSSFLPLKVNAAGVIPIIFAISIFMFPATVVQYVPAQSEWWRVWASRITSFHPGVDVVGIAAALVYFVLVVIFTYFYTAVTFKPTEIADSMKKNGGFIPGIRPGKPTAEYLDRLMQRITLPGALFLGLIALTPYYLPALTKVTTFSLVGGTSLLIVVGVAMDTMQQMEAHLLMRNYEGFLR